MDTRKYQLFKTEMCRNWQEMGECRYAKKCRFAHGQEELRCIQRHVRYKTEICKTFHLTGTCLYGVRCTFIHDEQQVHAASSPTISSTASSVSSLPADASPSLSSTTDFFASAKDLFAPATPTPTVTRTGFSFLDDTAEDDYNNYSWGNMMMFNSNPLISLPVPSPPLANKKIAPIPSIWSNNPFDERRYSFSSSSSSSASSLSSATSSASAAATATIPSFVII